MVSHPTTRRCIRQHRWPVTRRRRASAGKMLPEPGSAGNLVQIKPKTQRPTRWSALFRAQHARALGLDNPHFTDAETSFPTLPRLSLVHARVDLSRHASLRSSLPSFHRTSAGPTSGRKQRSVARCTRDEEGGRGTRYTARTEIAFESRAYCRPAAAQRRSGVTRFYESTSGKGCGAQCAEARADTRNWTKLGSTGVPHLD